MKVDLKLSRCWRAIVGGVAVLLVAACAGTGQAPSSAEPVANAPQTAQDRATVERAYLLRAQADAITRNDVTVSATALEPDEALTSLGIPLAEVGVQPVWVKIDNNAKHGHWLLPAFLDRDFFTAHEVAHLVGSKTGGLSPEQVVQTLVEREISNHVPHGQSRSGFVYTNLTRGLKLINIELLGVDGLTRFDFAREQQVGGQFDYQRQNPDTIHPPGQRRELTLKALGEQLAQMPCCTRDKHDQHDGDPLNLVMVGSQHDVLVALVRSGWDFTDTINAASVGHMIKSFLTHGAYPTSPVSALFHDGRGQDFAMQRARKTISQRNHLRLWITPFQVDGEPVWMGQISRDIGVKLTRHSPTFTTHVVDPNVDEAREYFLQSLLMTGNVVRWGLVGGVGAASAEAPRKNLGDDPYYTDGKRLVVFVAKEPRRIGDAEYLTWGN